MEELCTGGSAFSAVDQLEYVQKYLYPYRYKIKSYADLYMSIFFPVALGKAETWIIQTTKLSAAKIASANRIFDLDKNSMLTVSEVREAFLLRVPETLRAQFRSSVKKVHPVTVAVIVLLTVSAAVIFYYSVIHQ